MLGPYGSSVYVKFAHNACECSKSRKAMLYVVFLVDSSVYWCYKGHAFNQCKPTCLLHEVSVDEMCVLLLQSCRKRIQQINKTAVITGHSPIYM